ncbi:MAG: sulfotransferase domain-containing protein [Alphaproteobacteria bacterium]
MQRWLSDHPDVIGSQPEETRFLMDADDPLSQPKGYAVTGLEGYGAFFPERGRPSRYQLDVTPMYYYQQAAREIIPALPDARAIFLARRPGARLKSLYDYARNNVGVLPPNITFAEFVSEMEKGPASDVIGKHPMMCNGLQHSRYAEYLRDWMTAMGRDRLAVLIFEELIADPRSNLIRLANMLGIDPGFYDRYTFPKENESYSVSNRPAHRLARRMKGTVPSFVRKSLKPAYLLINTKRSKPAKTSDDLATMAYVDEKLSASEADLASLLGRDRIWAPSPA